MGGMMPARAGNSPYIVREAKAEDRFAALFR
jgi:hypothetical protein